MCSPRVCSVEQEPQNDQKTRQKEREERGRTVNPSFPGRLQELFLALHLVLCCDFSNETKPPGAHLVQEKPGGAAQGAEDEGIIIMSHLENLPQGKSPATTRRRPGRMGRDKAWET